MGAELVHDGEYILKPYEGEIELDLVHDGQYDKYMGGGGGGGTINLQTKSKTYTPSSSQQTDIVTADGGYDGLDIVNVTVNAVASGTAGTPTATKGTVSNHAIAVTPKVTNTTGYITGGTKTGTAVSVSASELVSGTRSITTNGNNIDVTNYAAVNVNVSGGGPTLQAKTNIAPTTSSQTITADVGYDGLSSVQINAMPSGTAGTPTATKGAVSNHAVSVTPSVTNTTGYITGSTKTGTAVSVSASELVSGTKSITANGSGIDVTNYAAVDVSVPQGGANLYEISRTYTPSQSKQTEIIHPPTGYDGFNLITNIINAIPSDYVGTDITRRSSSDLTASGATVTAPAGYYENAATKTVASGSASPAASISATGASVSTGTNTLTLSKTVSNTPQVSAGYVSSGTSGNSSVSLTASVTTKAAQTYNPSLSDRTIAAGTYLTGAQTIKGAALQNMAITENGTYQPDEGYYGFNQVTVNVGADSWNITKKEEDDRVDDGLILYSEADVAVSDIGAFVVYSTTSVTSLQNGDVVAILADSSGMRAWIYDNNAVSQLNYFSNINIQNGQVTGVIELTLLTSSYKWSDTTYNALFIHKSGGGSISFQTDDYQPGSGVTSAQFSVSENPPIYFCGLETEVQLASYHRVQTVVKHFDGDLMLCGTNFYTGNLGYLSSQLSESYANGTLTISTNNYNDGGYFHNPGTYNLYYLTESDLEGGEPRQSKTVTPTTSTQTVTADQGYVLGSVTVNPIPGSYVQPTSTVGATTYRASTSDQTIASGTYHSAAATIAAVSQTNLTAANIKNGTTITISNGQSNLWSVTGTYSGGGGGSVNVATTTWTNTSTSTVSHQFTGLSGTPKAAFLRCTSQLTRSSSNTYYYIADIVWDGTDTRGNYHLRSNGSYNDVPSTGTAKYNVTVGTNSITFSSTATSRSSAPGSFYNGTYELTYVY